MLDIDVIEKIHEYDKMGYKDAQIARKLKIDTRSAAKYRAVDLPVLTQKQKDIDNKLLARISQLEKAIGIQPPIQPQIQPQQQQTATNTATRKAQQQEEKELYPGETFHKQLWAAITEREKRTNAHAEPKPAEDALLEKINKTETRMNEQNGAIQQPVQELVQQPTPIQKQKRDWRDFVKDLPPPGPYDASEAYLDGLSDHGFSFSYVVAEAQKRRTPKEEKDD
jgi:hypothetical protein